MPSGPKHRLILGANIRHYRQRAALRQEKLAEQAELSTVFINRVEAGKENISVDALHIASPKASGRLCASFSRGFDADYNSEKARMA